MSEERTVCLVVLAKVGKWVKVDVTMEVYMRPTENQMGTAEYGGTKGKTHSTRQ